MRRKIGKGLVPFQETHIRLHLLLILTVAQLPPRIRFRNEAVLIADLTFQFSQFGRILLLH